MAMLGQWSEVGDTDLSIPPTAKTPLPMGASPPNPRSGLPALVPVVAPTLAALPANLAPPAPRRLRDPGEASAEAILLARALGVSITAGDVFLKRGLGADEATRRYLEPRLSHLTPPDAMADRDASAERLARAVRARERICIFGDYDCDGITATAIMTSILRALGGEVVPLLATRREGSYGLSARALERVLATGATLLVTCDCGSSDHERLDVVRSRGIDAVVIDHHLVPEEPLPVYAFLNPHRPDCGFPYKGMASCGLALSLGAALRRALGVDLDLRPYLDLVAIGTIADVAPLDGDNRALVRAGLSVICGAPLDASMPRGLARPRPGLRALAENAKIDLSLGIRAEDVAFRIAPRLNAPGRLGDPDLSLQLLLEPSAVNAAGIAAAVEQLAVQRRTLQDEMLRQAFADIEASGWGSAPGIVVARKGWHPGIVGIVAGRIASRYGRPTIVVALETDKGRGSVRGPAGSRLHDALTRCRHELVGFGGHQAAAGVEVRADRVEALRDAWCAAFVASPPAGGADSGEADVRLDDRDDLGTVVRDLHRLEPCGEKNRAPQLLVPGVKVLSARNLKGHLRVELGWGAGGRSALGGFGFEMGELAEDLIGGHADVVGQLRADTWKGGEAVELRVERIVRV